MEDIIIYMGHGVKDDFDKAFKEFIKNDFNYFHPVTGKSITREEFDIYVKGQQHIEE